MNKNILIVLGGAVLVAVLVAVIVQMTLGGAKDGVVEEAKVEVLVAAANLGIGRELQAGDTKWQAWPEASIFPGAIIREAEQAPEEALEGRLARNIASGEPVMRSALLAQTSGNLVAARLEAGMRAVAIEVDASGMVGGFVGPGDYVDIILTYRSQVRTTDDNMRVEEMIQRNLDEQAAETILQNVQVLAIDQNAKPVEEEEKGKIGKVVTLGVAPQDAERLALAAKMGDLTLALRGVGDNTVSARDWKTVSDKRITSITDEIYDEYKQIKKESHDNKATVRVYNGADVVNQPTLH